MGHVVKMVEGEYICSACFGNLLSDVGPLLHDVWVFQAIAGSCLDAARLYRRRWTQSLASSSGLLVVILEETDTRLRRSSVGCAASIALRPRRTKAGDDAAARCVQARC